MFSNKHKLFHTLFELTLRCNMQCIHCGSAAGTQRIQELSTTQWLSVCDQLTRLNCKQITLMGGEPFLRNDWYTIAQHVRNQNMNLTMMSNSYVINDRVIRQLRTLEPYVVAISLDGATSETHDTIRGIPGSFDRCISCLDSLRKAGLPTTVVTTVHKKNVHELKKMRELLLNKQIAWQIQMGTPFGRFPTTLALSLEEFYGVAMFIAATRKQYSIKELPVTGAHCMGYHSSMLPNVMMGPWKGCFAGMNVLGIQSNGGIKGCLTLPDEYTEGNVKDVSIIDVWNNVHSFQYTRNFQRENLNGACRLCDYGNRCRGGCLASSISFTGKPYGNPYCLRRIERDIIKK